MTSYERVMTALDKGVPDRVPYTEFYINRKFIKDNFMSYSYAEFLDLTGIDVVMVPSPDTALKKLSADTYKDSWNTIYKDTGEGSLIEFCCPISTKDDLLKFSPPNPLEDPRLAELEKIVCRYKNQRAIVFPISDALSRPRTLLGLEKLLISYLDDPELVQSLIDISLDYYEKLLERAIELGADILISADDYAGNAGPLIGPNHFRQFILPGLTRLVKRTHELGARYIKHTDGDINSLLSMIVDSGIDGLHPIEERAGMDILKVKKEYGNSICIIGSIDCRDTLCNGSEEEVIEEVGSQISKFGPGGGYMIASSNSIHSGVKPGNFMVMARAVRELGAYPINVKRILEYNSA